MAIGVVVFSANCPAPVCRGCSATPRLLPNPGEGRALRIGDRLLALGTRGRFDHVETLLGGAMLLNQC